MANQERLFKVHSTFQLGETRKQLDPHKIFPELTIATSPNSSVFKLANPFPENNNFMVQPADAPIGDDDFDVEVVSFEEKSKVVSNLTTKKERVLEGTGKVISFFKEAADYKLKNLNDFRTLAEQATVMARLNAAACAPGDGHGGIQTSAPSISSSGEISTASKISSLFGKKEHSHKPGEGDHCTHNNDYGSCPEGCKKAA